MNQYRLNKPGEKYSLDIGDRLVFDDSLFTGFEIVYAGKPSDNQFSLLCSQRGFFIKEMDGNLFFPITTKNLNLYENQLEVLAVDENMIQLKHIK